MKVTINIPDELAAQAQSRGLPVEVHVEEMLAHQWGPRSSKIYQARKPEEIRAWLDSLAQFSDKIPPLPETISCEWIYKEHD